MMKIQTSLVLISVALMHQAVPVKPNVNLSVVVKQVALMAVPVHVSTTNLKINMERMDLKKISIPCSKLNPSKEIWSIFPISA
jgi:hypothetical protein